MANEFNITVTGEQKTLEIRQGSALPLHELKNIELRGSINAPGDFLDVRRNQFQIESTHVIVNKDYGTITLNSNDQEEVGRISVTGELTSHPDFLRLGINDPESSRTTGGLASFIKMNRSFFETKSTAMNLVSLLRNFKASVNKQLEERSDDRGNYALLKEQIVESNIPEAFTVKLPLFIGEPPVSIMVEIVIDPEDFSCALISPEAADMIRERKEKIMNEQINRFDGYVVIYK